MVQNWYEVAGLLAMESWKPRKLLDFVDASLQWTHLMSWNAQNLGLKNNLYNPSFLLSPSFTNSPKVPALYIVPWSPTKLQATKFILQTSTGPLKHVVPPYRNPEIVSRTKACNLEPPEEKSFKLDKTWSIGWSLKREKDNNMGG